MRKTHSKEAHVKEDVKELLKRYGAWYCMPIGGAFSAVGVPDFLVCYRGRFMAIETKFGNNKPTPMQQRALTLIEEAGGLALVINEENIAELDIQLGTLNAGYSE